MARNRPTLTRYASHLRYGIETFLLRRMRPYLFILVINDGCNLDCFYCSAHNTGQYDLDFATAAGLLKRAYRQGHRALVLTGGEPMFWRSEGKTLADIVNLATEIGFREIAVFTNGTFPLRMRGCRYIVTVDGTREIHESIRPGTYDLILAHVREAEADVMASITITKANAPHLEATVESIAAAGCFRAITFNLLTDRPEVLRRLGVCGGTGDGGTTDTGAPDVRGDSSHPDGGGPDSGPGDAGHDATDAVADSPVFAADACSGANTCAPVAPSGWQGPLVIWEGTGTPPSCASFYLDVFDGGSSPSGSAASCSCSCGPATGSTCGPATVQFGTTGCGGSCGSAVTAASGACVNVQTQVTACGSGASMMTTGSTADGGGCQPDASVDAQAPTWANLTVACAPSSQSTTGCNANQVCVPGAGSPFESTFCVLKAGNNTCPSPFTNQHLYYSGITDTRGCTPCTCGSPSGVDCNSNAHLTTWSNTSCNTGKGGDFSPLPLSCGAIGASHYAMLTTSPTGGTCTPSGGTPTGGVTAANLTTICCL